jgi:hypothetical protein
MPQNQVNDLIIGREKILARLWELANLSHHETRNSITGQLKAISMIADIEGHIPDLRAKGKKAAELEPAVNIYQAPWLLETKARAAAEAAGFDLVRRELVPQEQPDAPSSSVPVAPHPKPEARYNMPRTPYGDRR